jgi:MoaA/NifB/PqqE/SkfB family radical SAM enzyme
MALRYLWMLTINTNRILNRSFVPVLGRRLFIEPARKCNIACRFCSYSLAIRPRLNIDQSAFEHCLKKAASIGSNDLWVTPMTGDVFMDKRFIDKLEMADASLSYLTYRSTRISLHPIGRPSTA